jgi:hypothetical protein
MIRFYSYPFCEILGGLFEIFDGSLPKNFTLHGGFHAFYHSSGKLLIPSNELFFTPFATYYKNLNVSVPSNILETRYWFLNREEFRKFYRECRNIRRVNDKAWHGLLHFDKPGSVSDIIILRWKGDDPVIPV